MRPTEAVDRRAMGISGGFAATSKTATRLARSAASTQPSLFRRYLVDSADRCGVALPAGGVSVAFHVLATAPALGDRRRMAAGLADTAGGVDQGGLLKWDKAFLDGSFAAKKGGSAVGKTKRGKGTKWMVLVDSEGLPLGVRLESASPSEVTLAEATLAEVRVPQPKGRPRQNQNG